jgi:diaminohydroxyphosphoribosylaminopyrimidine deaminase/5-amino-6-(5-phosphoribosylamino)uracil reductase
MEDNQWMKLAIQEGMKGRLDAPPNPWVGCVIVKDGLLVGKGYHPECGKDHAEVFALNDAGEKAQGATAYVTLEPCSHHGRTPPCVHALIKSGLRRVVVGIEDPDQNVAGSGIKALKEAGIKVDVGIEKESVERSLLPYLHQRRTGRPFVVAKIAVSIDGKVAAEDGSSQWISCEKARQDVHEVRARSQAILIGSGTAIKDSPRLTVRNVTPIPKRPPLRVVLDRSGKVPKDSPIFDQTLAPTLLFSDKEEVSSMIETLPTCGPKKMLQILGKRDILQVMIEGGPNVISSFLQEGLVDELLIYFGPKILGSNGLSAFGSMGIHSIAQAQSFRLTGLGQLGDTIKASYLRS